MKVTMTAYLAFKFATQTAQKIGLRKEEISDREMIAAGFDTRLVTLDIVRVEVFTEWFREFFGEEYDADQSTVRLRLPSGSLSRAG